jgi:hypothetical protein
MRARVGDHNIGLARDFGGGHARSQEHYLRVARAQLSLVAGCQHCRFLR